SARFGNRGLEHFAEIERAMDEARGLIHEPRAPRGLLGFEALTPQLRLRLSPVGGVGETDDRIPALHAGAGMELRLEEIAADLELEPLAIFRCVHGMRPRLIPLEHG